MYSPVSRVRVFFPHGAPRRPPAGRERIGAVKGVRRSGGPDLINSFNVDRPVCARGGDRRGRGAAGLDAGGGDRTQETGVRPRPVRRACPIGNAHDSVGCVDWMRGPGAPPPPDLSRTSRDVGRPDRSSHTLRLPLMAPRAVGSGTPLLPPLSYTRPTSGQRHKSRCVRASRRSHSFQRPSGSGSAHTLLALTHPCDCDSSFPVSPS
jgi:hypothetical protein